MSIVVPIKDGKVVENNASQDSLAANQRSGSSLDKEAFLQLLVAQMKYQDPLEPTSNTEYISQLGTFSSLEEMQNLNGTMTTQHATNLVGKTVIMNVQSSTGATNVVQGKVDFIVKQNNKVYLSIDDQLYNIDDLDKVVDDDYLEALAIAEDFEKVIGELPSVKNLRLDDKDQLERVRKAYNNLTTYQQDFIAKYCPKALEKLKELLAKMKEMTDAAGGTDGDDKTDGDNKVDGDNNVDGDNKDDKDGTSTGGK